jgi:hypothetical protein
MYSCLVGIFHPQDLLAMGLGLGAIALSRRSHWISAGVLVGLAVTSQQFAILIAVPLLFVPPWKLRIHYVVAAISTVALVTVPFIIASTERALRPVLLGSSRVGYIRTSTGGTVLWELHLQGPLLFALARGMPIAGALLLAWWAQQRIGLQLHDPVALTSLIATSLCLRLIFEVNLFPYYFMAVAVALIVLELARGELRGSVVAWLSLVTLTLYPLPFGVFLTGRSIPVLTFQALPLVVVVTAVAMIIRDIRRHYVPWYLIGWLLVIFLTCVPYSSL